MQNINPDQQIKEIQKQFPLLSHGSPVKDVIHKVQGLDKDNALKTLAAYHILRNLQEFQALESGGVGGGAIEQYWLATCLRLIGYSIFIYFSTNNIELHFGLDIYNNNNR